MKSRIFNTILGVNTVVQAIFSMLTPIAAGALIAFFLERKNIAGPWIYVVLIILGVFVGLISTVSFLIKEAEIDKARIEAMKQAAEEEEKSENE